MMSKSLIVLIFLIVCAYTICLMPGPKYWEERLPPPPPPTGVAGGTPAIHTDDSAGVAGGTPAIRTVGVPPAPESSQLDYKAPLRSFLTENIKTKERLGHLLPMIGIAWCLIRLLLTRGWRWYAGLLAAWAFVFGIALSIELLQELLPEWFHRGFALDDIGFSMLGGLLGSLGGFLFLTAKERIDRERISTTAALEGLRGTSEGK